ncbi:uncharacterized protein G2W53_006069 [Senna tora]|uniref:Uncharacterized protein n=1 Tax=Senna tora TaxID=362788 RepID=A0A835CG50_9FABA|nr:uncharacterized protein G2W53_006069 [Senna tora]
MGWGAWEWEWEGKSPSPIDKMGLGRPIPTWTGL